MLRISAIAAEDGWAFVNEDERLWLIRPPYRATSRLLATIDQRDRAISSHAFAPTAIQCRDWAEVIAILREQFLSVRQGRKDLEPGAEAAVELVRTAPEPIVAHYLERIHRELIPGGELDAASRILHTLLHNATVRQREHLFDQVTAAIQACSEAQIRRQLQLVDATDVSSRWQAMFPRSMARYGSDSIRSRADDIRTVGQIMHLCPI